MKGYSLTYYSNGNKTAEGNYNADEQKEGYWEYYTYDDQISSGGSYIRGVKSGEWTEYEFDRLPKDGSYELRGYHTGNYLNGKPAGIWHYYDRQGRLLGSRSFE